VLSDALVTISEMMLAILSNESAHGPDEQGARGFEHYLAPILMFLISY